LEVTMAIRALIDQIAALWPAYHRKVTVDHGDPADELVTRRFPEILRPHVADYESIVPEGSTGKGNITAAPWVALFDRRLTTSATKEYYVVYLFSTDMSAVTLALIFGTTQFENQFGRGRKSFPWMRSAAARLQETFKHLIPSHLSREPIDLAAKPRQSLHYAYQQSAILSYPPYRVGSLPDDPRLVADLRELVGLYTQMVSDPLEPTVERLVEAVIQPAGHIEPKDVREFEPRPAKEGRGSGGSKKLKRRYSPESRKVGDAGERAVMRREKELLIGLGRQDLADHVRWHAQEGEFPGWDITSFDADGREFFIEVKSCAGKAVSSVDLTVNEWKAARDAARRDRYYIYLVTSALSAKPVIERLRNPASYVDDRQLSCEPIVYELDLRRQ
jgi:hypothetical protein